MSSLSHRDITRKHSAGSDMNVSTYLAIVIYHSTGVDD
jgi:hypothetical protein